MSQSKPFPLQTGAGGKFAGMASLLVKNKEAKTLDIRHISIYYFYN